MRALKDQKCEECGRDEPVASQSDVARWMPEIPEWRVEEPEGVQRLVRVFSFPDFATALAFTLRVGAVAEAEGHHPALTTEWGRVTVQWWTHSIGGLHRNDFIMAARTDEAFSPR